MATGRSELFTIDVDFDATPEEFSSDSPLLCPTGDAETFFRFGTGREVSRATSFHLWKEIVCDDGSGSFVIGLNAATNFVVGEGTVGGWRVIDGSGTGDYEGLTGGGNIVGFFDDGNVDIHDHYFGSLSIR